jgi:ABC-type multidrug transport system ATPase subunit
MPREAAVHITDLSKYFGGVKALDGVSFDIPANTLFGLLGPNGAGKTTLFSLAAGFLKPTRGSVEVLGINVEYISELRGRLTILPQDAMFEANIPLLEQLIFFGRLTGYSRADAHHEALRALSLVGLGDSARRNARVLSHGMAKRLGIAQAFLGRPEVIFLDEPTAGLDPANAKSIRELIRRLKQTTTVIISSHDLDEIQEMCSHVAIIDKGRLIECNEVAAITQADKQIRMSFTRALTAPESNKVLEVAGVTSLTMGQDNEYTIHIDLGRSGRTQENIITDVVQKLVVTGLVPRSISEGASLEDRFLQVTGTGEAKVLCPHCGADLAGNERARRCPECGQPLAAAEPAPRDDRIRPGQ